MPECWTLRPSDLLETARHLAVADRHRPRQARLRRAVSSAYYAVFHHLAATCSDLLVGAGRGGRRSPAWRHVYRSLEHGLARSVCIDGRRMATFPVGVRSFAESFVALQRRRHLADYDPAIRFTRLEVLADIGDAAAAIRGFHAEAAAHRRAFAALVRLKSRT